jgi:hydroxyacylglutathione hydrolase
MSTFRVVPVPVLSDNYAYLLIDERDKVAAAVDPVEPKKVLEAAEKEGVPIKAIYTTHHHWDHAGGNEELLKSLPKGTPVYGADDRIPGLTHKVADAETLQLGSTNVEVLFTPCHTAGHVLFLAGGDSSPRALFSGDTLFIGGCGRFFEGTAQQMYHALVEVCAQLPHDTQVWCGHEYTVKNLQFAQSVEKDNQDLQTKLKWAEERRNQDPPQPTIPSTIGDELQCNPFMRVQRESIKQALNLDVAADPVEAMAKLRQMKDKW